MEGATTSAARAAPSPDVCQVVELRRYALRPGQRDALITLFDREFVETQEAVGMCVLGQFRDLDDPDSFVWLRGFKDMPTRKKALEAFYGGPVWRKHAHAANATMINSDDVRLLRPVAGLKHDPTRRAAHGRAAVPPGLLAVTILPVARDTAAGVPVVFRESLEPALLAAGISVLATYSTEHSKNTFPGLPVRENEDVFVWLSMFADEAEHGRRLRALEHSSTWRRVYQALAPYLAGTEEVLRLRPTARSALHA